MRSGFVSLDDLYMFIQSPPVIERHHLDPRSDAGRAYNSLCKILCLSIPDKQGLYLWGNYDKKWLWHNIYLGKAGFGKTAHLRARILEELRKSCTSRTNLAV